MRPTTILFMLALVLALVAQVFGATTTSTAIVMQGMPNVTITVNAATTGDVVCTDTGALGGGTKRAQVVRFVSNAQTKYVLTRVQRSAGGLWIDEIAAETTTALATRILAFDLTTAAPGHPSPTHDAVDDAVSALMIGYTGS